MADTTYTYEGTAATADSIDRLELEISQSDIVTALRTINLDGTSLHIVFKDALSVADKAALDSLVSAHTGEPLPPQPVLQPVSLETLPPVTISGVDASTTEKTMKVSTTKLEGSSTLLVSPNLCDKTTWYEKSTPVTAETLTTSDNLTFASAHGYWIDLTHGKVSYEDRISGYNPVIRVDGTIVTTGFEINYTTGAVVFSDSQEGKVVTADYSYATTFSWSVYPSAGKILKMIGTYIKCTDDVSMVVGEIIDFQLLIGGAPYGYPTTYKSFDDFLKCCSDIKRIEKFGSMEHDVIQLDFDYITSKDLKYNQGASIEIKITGGSAPLTGTWSCVVANVISVSL